MKATVVVMVGALVLCAADVHAMASGGKHARGGQSHAETAGGGGNGHRSGGRAPLPEPSTLYAIGSSLAALAGARWYIRRRD
jgi:hypothetical protein